MHGLAVDSLSMDLNEKLIILFALHELPEHPNTSILCMFLLLVHCTIVSSACAGTYNTSTSATSCRKLYRIYSYTLLLCVQVWFIVHSSPSAVVKGRDVMLQQM